MKNNHYRIMLIIFIITIVVLSALPNSGMLRTSMVNEDGLRIIVASYYSSFNLILFGNANFGPLLSSIIASIMTILSFIAIFIKKQKFDKVLFVISIIGLSVSLFPYFLSCVTVFTIIISIIWFMVVVATAIVSYKLKIER